MELKNIRSYTEEKIEFPPGSVLLSGDIGCGKSTILYAIEFALFGLRSDLSGNSLLREGKNNGSVSLKFQVNDKEVTVERTLKRTKDTVNQDSGALTVNGQRRESTATEITAKILEFLGYPPELVRKKKSRIYRYTVYTPQEQMKQILLFDKEIRYDTLRKVFGIDKYQRIKENADEVRREVKSRRRELESLIQSLGDVEKEKKGEEEKKGEKEKNLKEIKGKVSQRKQKEEERGKTLDKIEEKLKKVNQWDKKLEAQKTERKGLKKILQEKREEKKELAQKIKEVREKLKEYELEKPQMLEEEIKDKLEELEKNEKNYIKRDSTLEDKISNLRSILDIGVCPTCEQEVSDRESFKGKINHKVQQKKKSESILEGIKEKKEKLELKREKARKYKEKKKEKENLKEKIGELKERKNKTKEELKEKFQKVKELEKTMEELQEKIESSPYEDLEKRKKKVRGELEDIRKRRVKVEKKEAALQQEIKDIKEKLEELEQKIKKKEKAKKNKQKLSRYEDWVKNYFMELMSIIETHVMVNIQKNFNLLFQEWFNKLVEERTITVRLDDHFSPVIEQNGYEIAYDYLSGGERTSVALAYRLALNKIVNTLTEDIKTKDLLILDEPTDGFSMDQMESIRAILDELGVRQVIMVSHEPKIESLVENVINIKKKNHQSRVS